MLFEEENSLHVIKNKILLIPYESIHENLSFLLFWGQMFATFPVQGLWEKDTKKIKFKLISIRTFMAFYNLIGGIFMSVFCCLKFYQDGMQLSKLAPFSFYTWNALQAYNFIKLATNWDVFVNEWSTIDKSIRSNGFSKKLKTKLHRIAICCSILAICEHLLFIVNGISTVIECTNTTNVLASEYFQATFPHVFTTIEFSVWKGVLVEIFNLLMTGLWNFTDIFIILICTTLAVRFQQLNRRLNCENFMMNANFWKTFREDYSKLTRLCVLVDEHLSPIILFSIVNNLCFICIQLYNSIKPRQGIIEIIYFFYSFGFLSFRILAVSLYVAWINDESKKSLSVIHTLPTEQFDYEVSRLLHQIYTQPVALSGSKCFIITRALILRITGTIVTFVLMLLQFGPYFEKANRPEIQDIQDCFY